MRHLKFSLHGLWLILLFNFVYADNVVVIESYHSQYRWDAQYLKAINNILGKNHNITVYELDTKHLSRELWPQRALKIRKKLQKNKPDIVILGDDNALTLMAEDIVNMGIPVIFLGVNGGITQHPIIEHPQVAGILERPFFAKNIRHLRKVLDKRDNFLILMDDSPTMRNAVTEYFGEKRNTEIYGSNIDIVLSSDKQTWLAAMLGAKDKYDAVIVGTYHSIRDENDQYVQPKFLMDIAYEQAGIPIFSFWDIFIGKGQGAGGFTVSAYQEGATASRLAAMILGGVKPSRIPKMQSLSGTYVYSASGMEHWGIELSTLTASQAMFVD